MDRALGTYSVVLSVDGHLPRSVQITPSSLQVHAYFSRPLLEGLSPRHRVAIGGMVQIFTEHYAQQGVLKTRRGIEGMLRNEQMDDDRRAFLRGSLHEGHPIGSVRNRAAYNGPVIPHNESSEGSVLIFSGRDSNEYTLLHGTQRITSPGAREFVEERDLTAEEASTLASLIHRQTRLRQRGDHLLFDYRKTRELNEIQASLSLYPLSAIANAPTLTDFIGTTPIQYANAEGDGSAK